MIAKVLKVLNEGASLEDWNHTIITLIPKIKDHMLVKDFRPISLCNFCYKIEWALTNSLRLTMNSMIGDNQSTFIPGRIITDNVILDFEALHWMRTRVLGK